MTADIDTLADTVRDRLVGCEAPHGWFRDDCPVCVSGKKGDDALDSLVAIAKEGKQRVERAEREMVSEAEAATNYARRVVALEARVAALEARLYFLEDFRGDVMAGCDIQRGGRLFRQVEVVIGPGKTRSEIRVAALERRVADLLGQAT